MKFIGASRRCLIESFARAFSKARRLVMFSQKTHDEGTCARSNTSRSAVALRRGRNSLILPKRHRRVNAEPRLGRGDTFARGKGGERFATGEVNNTQVGVFPNTLPLTRQSFLTKKLSALSTTTSAVYFCCTFPTVTRG